MASSPSVLLPDTLRWFFFDLDMTLWDHNAASARTIDTMSARLGVDPAAFLASYRRITHAIIEEIDRGEIDVPTSRVVRFERLLTEFGFDLAAHDVPALSEAYLDEYTAYAGSMDGAREVLALCARIGGVGVVTNAGHRTQDAKLAQLAEPGTVDWMLTTDETNCLKPAAKFYDMAEELAGNPDPETILMVGDDWVNDVRAAVDRGYWAVWISPDPVMPEPLPRTIHLRSVGELLPHLEPLAGSGAARP
jgi:HAD superfamily hydrolase (TIGR01549 family)